MVILGSKESLGKPSTGSMYFEIRFLVMLYAMGSSIACNGAMVEGNDCVNLLIAL